MIMNDKCKQHVDSCRFCWMCHHICPIGNATGLERDTARARALGLSLVNRETFGIEEVIDNVYECACCGGCVNVCVTGWDPVMFTKETRLNAALDGKLPEYINRLLDNIFETGNAYGIKNLDKQLEKAISAHSDKTDALLLLGVDARTKVPDAAIKAIKVLEKANIEFTVLKDELPSGQQLEYLIGAADETKKQMSDAAKQMSEYKNIIVYDPQDAKVIKREYKEWGIDVKAEVKTFTSFIASLIKEGKLTVKKKDITVTYQDPFQLSRDLGETEDARDVIKAAAELREMLCFGKETIWAGNILMGEWMSDVIEKVAKKRIFNATSIGVNTIVTTSVSEYAALKSAAGDDISVLTLEDLILD